MKTLRCPNKDCRFLGKTAPETIIRFGFYRTRWGSAVDIDAKPARKRSAPLPGLLTIGFSIGGPRWDQVATLSVEGRNKSAIARVQGISWNTVDRWLEKASYCSRRFNDKEDFKPQSFRPTKSEP